MAVDSKFFDARYKEIGVTEFFKKNLHMLGYSGPIKSFTTIVHEFVTNALDACEEGGILPEIQVTIRELGDRHYLLVVQDNGTGIPPSYIPRLFGKMLAGTKFHRYIQSRGQQGIGAVGAILYSQMTTGKPVKIITSTGNGKIHQVVMEVDVKKNKGHVHEQTESKGTWRGTRFIAEFKDVLYHEGEQGVFEYLRRTSIANPHLKLNFDVDLRKKENGKTVRDKRNYFWDRVVFDAPPVPKPMKPHPLGVTADELREMCHHTNSRKLSSALSSEFCRISSNKTDKIAEKLPEIDFDMDPRKLSHEQAEKIVEIFRDEDMNFHSPPTDGLIPITSAHIEKSLKDIIAPDYIALADRKPSVYRGGIPFLVEVAIAYGGGAGRKLSDGGLSSEIMRFSNRTPLLFDTGACALTKAVRDIDWKRYKIDDFEKAQITVFVNLISPHIPYTSAGKQAVADDEDIVSEIRFAVMEAGRRIKTYLSGLHRAKVQRKRREVFLKYIPEVAFAVAHLSSKKERKNLPKKEIKEVEKNLDEIVKEKFKKWEKKHEEKTKKEKKKLKNAKEKIRKSSKKKLEKRRSKKKNKKKKGGKKK